MIPDFKTYLNESVWGDIRKKSLGQEERLEFDVNQLNCEGLLEYLRKHYSFRNVGKYTYDKHLSGNAKFVSIPFAVLNTDMMCYCITYLPNYWGGGNNVIKISIDFFKRTYLKHLYRQLKTVFRCDKNELFSNIYIYPKDKNRTVDIKFFLEFLDYCATELVFEHPAICVVKQDEKMNESVWGDIRKKSLGQEDRLEDGVDNMDMESFYKYLKDKYDKDTFEIESTQDGPNTQASIWAEVIENIFLLAYYNKYTGLITKVVLRWFDCQIDDDILRELNKRYILQDDKSITCKKHIFEKETPVENHTFIGVLEFLIENKDSLLIEESVWGDIRKKSLGKEEREENNIVDNMKLHEFLQYLGDTYVSLTHPKEPWEMKFTPMTKKKLWQIEVPIEKVRLPEEKWTYILLLDYYDKTNEVLDIHFSSDNIFKDYPEICDFLRSEYNLHLKPKEEYPSKYPSDVNGFIIDETKDGERLKLHDFIRIVNVCSGFVKYPYLKFRTANMNESVWGDIRKKSLGQESRIERDVDMMEPNEFWEYLREIYFDGDMGYDGIRPFDYGIERSFSKNLFEITISFGAVEKVFNGKTYKMIQRLYLKINDETYKYESIHISDDVKGLEEILSENGYVFKKRLQPECSRVYPKDGEITNKTIINLIDLLLKTTEFPMLKKNEEV